MNEVASGSWVLVQAGLLPPSWMLCGVPHHQFGAPDSPPILAGKNTCDVSLRYHDVGVVLGPPPGSVNALLQHLQ